MIAIIYPTKVGIIPLSLVCLMPIMSKAMTRKSFQFRVFEELVEPTSDLDLLAIKNNDMANLRIN
ncbi:MAG: hypothetical protein F6K22_11180 [Okeania sp. SIO2F4]|uniref:hypothetical protein n=1 Tax=Okeania sp. SIO2F4 TaxID=2607790 RepID=UPI00142C375C|nr:hypothetical protein [Okeania sp. SIO2F4]NES03356.1 hypothetical protein [Okeania sp. SIO2F4]